MSNLTASLISLLITSLFVILTSLFVSHFCYTEMHIVKILLKIDQNLIAN